MNHRHLTPKYSDILLKLENIQPSGSFKSRQVSKIVHVTLYSADDKAPQRDR